jgi:hypothetical protein
VAEEEEDDDEDWEFPNEFPSESFKNLEGHSAPLQMLNVASTNKVEHRLFRQGIDDIVNNQRNLEKIKGRISNAHLEVSALAMHGVNMKKSRRSGTVPLVPDDS